MIARSLVTALIVAALPAAVSAQISTNQKVLAPFKSVVSAANESTVRIRCGEKDTALGTIVFADGFILTKASELHGPISVRFADGAEYDASIVGQHRDTDLAMLKVDVKNLKPVTFSDSSKVPAGSWLAAASVNSDPAGVGIVSVMTRKLTGDDARNRGYIGVILGDADFKDKEGKVIGALIETVSAEGAAKKAGIKPKDVITEVDGVKVPGRESLQKSLAKMHPGDSVTITLLRDGQEQKYKLTLTGDISPLNQKSRGDIQNSMGSSLSNRRTGFPAVLQTDMVVDPKNCGGPIVDLNGKVLGISIARAGRVETWILPSENIRPILADLKAGKYSPLKSTTETKADQ
jgi:serine protease Do